MSLSQDLKTQPTNPAVETNLVVSKEMVSQFARLTGDYNSLHINPGFGRTSAFRVNVVHGMLPVLFVLCPEIIWKSGRKAKIEKISATFLKPVFVNDQLRIIIEQENAPLSTEFAFRIVNTLSNAIVTTGRLELTYTKSSPREVKSHYGDSSMSEYNHESLLTEPLTERAHVSVEKGAKDSFTFAITSLSEELLCGLLRAGLINAGDFPLDQLLKHCDYANLLATTLCSTFVGMCIPGQKATFVDFQAKFEKDISWEKTYRFAGEVKFHSKSTNILMEDWHVVSDEPDGDDEALAKGQIKTKINDQRRSMPTTGELRDNAADLQLSDKVILITGASRGLGETIAKFLSLYKTKVVVNYRQGEEDALRIVQDIEQSGGQAFALQADITDQSQVQSMVKAVVEKYGPVDILVNNAVRNARPMGFMETTWDEIQKDMDVTLKGAFHCCQEVIPGMIDQGRGKIINMSTIFADYPPANQAKYVISKSALVGLTRSLAIELAPNNIQVNLIVPSLALTDLSSHIPKLFLEWMKNENPMKRHATPEEVARAVVFLASSLSSFTTGQKIMVTGGQAPLF